jgi:hypothetical protein
MVGAMVKQRFHDPVTGKLGWREVDAPATPPTPPAARATPAAPSKAPARRGRTTTTAKKPKRSKSDDEWDRLFDDAQDAADAES